MDMLGRGSRIAIAALALATLCSAARASEEGPPKKGVSLGLATQRLSDTWREKNAYKASGVLVVGVDPAGRAAKGGITSGDVLVSVDGRTLREPSDLGYAERTLHPDEPVAIVLARDGGHSIKMFDIAPATDAGPGDASPAVTATAADPLPAPNSTTYPDATSSPIPSSIIVDSAPATAAAAGALAVATDANTPNSIEPAPSIIIARADTGASADKPAKSGAEELGVRAQPLTPDLAAALASDGVEGVLILEVLKESPADHAGLRAGDIIFKIGDQPVKDMATLDTAVAAATNPAAINMIRRGDQEMVLAPLEGHPSPGDPAAPPAAADQDQVINELKGEVASLKKELADLKVQIAKLVQDSAKPKQ
jgi:membrane-associated protease RseP (regulator of RpoE activity)